MPSKLSAPSSGVSSNTPAQRHDHTPNFQQVACVECERLFSPMEVLNYGKWTVCAGCKDRFIQKLEQGGVIGGITAWRYKRLVRVLKENPTLPASCTKCGEPGEVEMEKTMRYLSMWSLIGFPALLFGVIPGLIIMTLLGTKVKMKFSQCKKHARRQKMWRWISAGTLIPALVLILLPTTPDWLPMAFTLLLLTGLIGLGLGTPGVAAIRGNKEHFDIRVQSRKLKKALPDWNDYVA